MGAINAHHGLLLAGVTVTSYNTVVAGLGPRMWWKLEDTSGTTAADSGSAAHPGTLNGGATFASTGVSISAPSGYAGLGKGVDFSATNVNDISRAAGGYFPMDNVTGGVNKFTILLWVAGSAGSNQYLASRVNDAAIIYQFTTDTVEFFSSGYTGSDPRTGSQISLPASDTTTPHLIAYVYDAGTWSGYKDGSQVFSVSRTFSLPGTQQNFYLGSDSGTSRSNSRKWEMQAYDNKALSASDISSLWNARNNP